MPRLHGAIIVVVMHAVRAYARLVPCWSYRVLALGSVFLVAIATSHTTNVYTATTPTQLTGWFHSAALDGRLHFSMWLPSDYSTSHRRYPVIYFLHGLPAQPTTYLTTSWAAQALALTGGQAILVAPQATRVADGDPEYLDMGPGTDWATALGRELPAFIDSHYRTVAKRAARALVGVSAGGYGAASIALSHPTTFSVVESWSGYFEPTTPSGASVLDLGSPSANASASIHVAAAALASQFRKYPTYLAFYVGRDDTRFLQDNLRLDVELRDASVTHVFALYPGAHGTDLWQQHAQEWFAMALSHLST